jgi:DNA-binding response OmpR family regulator
MRVLVIEDEPKVANLIDLTLPGRDGLDMITTVRGQVLETSVLVLTAHDTLGIA